MQLYIQPIKPHFPSFIFSPGLQPSCHMINYPKKLIQLSDYSCPLKRRQQYYLSCLRVSVSTSQIK